MKKRKMIKSYPKIMKDVIFNNFISTHKESVEKIHDTVTKALLSYARETFTKKLDKKMRQKFFRGKINKNFLALLIDITYSCKDRSIVEGIVLECKERLSDAYGEDFFIHFSEYINEVIKIAE